MTLLTKCLIRLRQLLLAGCVLLDVFAATEPTPPVAGEARPLSPTALAASRDGRLLFVACATGDVVMAVETATGRAVQTIAVPASSSGLALSADGARLYVTCAAPVSVVCVIDVATGRIPRRFGAGHTAMSPVLSPDGKTLHVCNRFDNAVVSYDVTTGKETSRIAVPREPVAAAAIPGGARLLVANHLHAGRADQDYVAASVSIIDTGTRRVVKEIALPNGSGLLRDVRVSPDGQHAVVTHQVSRFHLPTTQVEHGWINTNAVSLIDVRGLRLINTVLLDDIGAGAGNPWAAAWQADGRTLGITHAGTHEVSVIDFSGLLAKLATRSGAAADVPNDLSFLVGVRRRIRLADTDRGPRAVVFVGAKLYLANYFSDSLAVVDLAVPDPAAHSIPLQPPQPMSVIRRGEFLFNDATMCFQGWQSCASCHSSDGRVDALNWDNLNDGIGNPKNVKSLLYAHQTPPSMWLRVREDAATAVRAGIKNSMFTVRPEQDAEALDEYIQSLDPIPSPRLVSGQLSPAAQRGKQIFDSKTTGCAECHVPNRFFTNLAAYDVGTRGTHDQPADRFDTPSLVECWRSAPYFHDGSAATMREVIGQNRKDQHGHTTQLSAREVDDLVEYLLSL